MTTFWAEGEPIRVVTARDSGTPRYIFWQQIKHPVAQVVERWRIDVNWWEEHVWREYFELILSTGYWVTIYQDFLEKRWYLQRQYD